MLVDLAILAINSAYSIVKKSEIKGKGVKEVKDTYMLNLYIKMISNQLEKTHQAINFHTSLYVKFWGRNGSYISYAHYKNQQEMKKHGGRLVNKNVRVNNRNHVDIFTLNSRIVIGTQEHNLDSKTLVPIFCYRALRKN